MIKKYLIAGILVWAPIWITLLVIDFLLNIFDRVINLLPHHYQPDTLLGMHVPGLGLVIILLLIFFTGMLVSNVLGRYIIRLWESFLARIPLVRSLYSGVKQVLNTVFSPSNKSFRKVLLIEYPKAGLWTMAFQTGNGIPEINSQTGEELLSVYVPTTPNPTSGFLLFVPAKNVIELDISVDVALKTIISLGVVLPEAK